MFRCSTVLEKLTFALWGPLPVVMDNEKCKIVFDNGTSGIYQSGQTMRGTISLICNKGKKIRCKYNASALQWPKIRQVNLDREQHVRFGLKLTTFFSRFFFFVGDVMRG